jgi:hypothetical protein
MSAIVAKECGGRFGRDKGRGMDAKDRSRNRANDEPGGKGFIGGL